MKPRQASCSPSESQRGSAPGAGPTARRCRGPPGDPSAEYLSAQYPCASVRPAAHLRERPPCPSVASTTPSCSSATSSAARPSTARSSASSRIEGMDGLAGAAFLRAPARPTTTTWACSRSARRPATPAPGAARVGLYHLAWEVETLADLAGSPGGSPERGALVGATDHATTKALYAKDPDGIEFEVSWLVPADRLTPEIRDGRARGSPRSTWPPRSARFGAETRGGVGISVPAWPTRRPTPRGSTPRGSRPREARPGCDNRPRRLLSRPLAYLSVVEPGAEGSTLAAVGVTSVRPTPARPTG